MPAACYRQGARRPLTRPVSEFAPGAMMFGAMGNTGHGESIRMIHRALDAARQPRTRK